MNWNNSVWLFCERGTATSLLAEPVNAASNVIFLLAALAALWIYRKLPFARKNADHTLLIVLTLLVGFGSLLFHLFASQWSELLHMLPLLLFMMVFLAMALGRFCEIPPGWTVVITGFFVLASIAGLTMTCAFLDASLQPPWSVAAGAGGSKGATSCLNGSTGYIPSLLALGILSFILGKKGHKAASSLMLSTLLFGVALVFHAIDHLYCNEMKIVGHTIGTHFVWHGLVGLVLFTLMRASMVYQNELPVQEIIPPEPKRQNKL